MSDRPDIPWYNRMAYNAHRRDAEHNIQFPQGRETIESLVRACRAEEARLQRDVVKCRAYEDVLGSLSPNLPRPPVTPQPLR